MDVPINFIIVDDDKLVNTFCSLMIKKTFKEAKVTTFELPESGLEYIESEKSIVESETPTVLFLDINMPSMSGWEFLEKFELFNDQIKNRIKIYIFSSSVDERDNERAANISLIKDYLVKPLSKVALLSTVADVKSKKD